MNTDLLKIALRKSALVVPNKEKLSHLSNELNETTSALVANCAKLGYAFSEDVLQEVNRVSPKEVRDFGNVERNFWCYQKLDSSCKTMEYSNWRIFG